LQWITSTMLHERYISEEDLNLMHLTDTPEDAVDFIVKILGTPEEEGEKRPRRKVQSRRIK
jgi:predicted Rossmann-fold nucleotide-binding protein